MSHMHVPPFSPQTPVVVFRAAPAGHLATHLLLTSSRVAFVQTVVTDGRNAVQSVFAYSHLSFGSTQSIC
mgnify:CR=1 FL=1